MKKQQLLKILALLLFVGMLAGATYYLYNNFVVKSPYHQATEDE